MDTIKWENMSVVNVFRRQSIVDCPIRGDYQTTKKLPRAKIAVRLTLEILHLPVQLCTKMTAYRNYT